MKAKAALLLVVLLPVFSLSAAAEDKKPAGLEQFKQLAGEWVGKEIENGKAVKDVHVRYKVTSAGSTVVETLFPDTDHEMVTVIHQDGDDLALTHYCALGNQPHMKTKGPSDGRTIAFKFTGASNLKSEKDMHMREVTFTFVDKGTLKSEWTHYHEGKPAGTIVFEFMRKK